MSNTEAFSETALDVLIRSPFARLNALLEGIPPGADPILFSLGEPHTALPSFVQPVLDEHIASFGKYPPIRGIPELRHAISSWLARRYPALDGVVDPERHVLPLNGSREGLFSAIFPALARKPEVADPAVLIPNPFYQVYAAASAVAGAEPIFLRSGAETGFLPDLDKVDVGLLRRTVALYLCSPSNPEGAVASRDYLEKAIRLARTHDFLLCADECYSEIYTEKSPAGALEVAQAATGSLANVVSFQSLSKRSGLPGLRSGFVAGDSAFLAAFERFRNVACPQVPLPIQYVSAAAWADETHVEQARAFYRANFEAAEAILQGRYGYARPEGGFFLWLNLADFGGGEKAAKTLWKGCGVKVLPGTYLTKSQDGQADQGRDYVRLALVHDAETTRDGLARIVATLG
ncbi:aminotransferase class I/II-fold pyridoxal phosphate-dependent enzyme [Methyloceanibacter caenitepidi]|uniref:N-succinyl-L,L-diaminopimelate aminotransferase alternative n=1 Tax=Methyloceanibacter caenitepidi TaxID=1384459 RepID=A0A0A8JZN9_9HYPH|nr:aminotransferase class I/II-fold pyridoxal phosphate-dependent enzyme [Methyloceanibacter caenitepidi]BAQ15812.1 N-succinyl-L,L-diaminopimelate aminotransferase alternative [Methyloceanibacter caenitepidi]